MERHIAHINCPSFPIQMEILRFPSLNGRPIAVVPRTSQTTDRAVVRAVSEEAVRSGVRRGMHVSIAKKACRDLEVLPFDEGYYRSGTDAIYEIACRMSPIAEPVTFGKAYADLSFTKKDSHRLTDICWKAINDLRRDVGITPAVGLAGNKLVSTIASRVSEANDIYPVESGQERQFLYPLLANHLPVTDGKIWRRLCLMGLKLIGSVAGFGATELALIFGRNGAQLHEQANGIDFTPVLTPQPSKGKVFGEILVPDTNDLEILHTRLSRLVESASMDLRSQGLYALGVSLAIEYSDSRKTEKSQRLAKPSFSNKDIRDTVGQLFTKMLQRRVSVRMITLRIPELVQAVKQLSLFETQGEEKHEKIDRAMDCIRQRFGEKAICRAKATL